MQNILVDIIGELQQMLTASKELEAKYQGQILALEKIIHLPLKTTPQLIKKALPKKEQQQQQISKEQVELKVAALLDEIQQKQKIIQQEPKQKIEVKLPQIVPEKKPPIPGVNRNEKAKNYMPNYVPPKNKNEVTGKVTQTTIKTNTQKVFRPEINPVRKSNSREAISSKNLSKTRQSLETKPAKKQEQREEIVPPKKIEEKVAVQSIITVKSDKQQSNLSVPKPASKQVEYQPVRMASFKKQLELILEELCGNSKKNRRQVLQKMIKEYQHEELGHKKHEQASRIAFIKQSHNYSVSRQQVHSIASFKMQRTKWKYHPELFELEHILTNLQNQIDQLQNPQEYRIDPKQEYRIVQTLSKLEESLDQIEEDKQIVPDQLNLSFTHSKIAESAQQMQDDIQQLYSLSLDDSLLKLLKKLQTISQSSPLQKPELRALQVLSQIGVFKLKKSPILVLQSQYEQWQNYYFE